MSTVNSWNEISWDPNATAVVRWRNEQLEKAHQPPIDHRLTYLHGLAKGKKVLDVGVVEHDAVNEQTDTWLHKHLVDAADSVLGVDILADGVKALQERGYNVVLHDLSASPLDDTFDLVIAGELIEHLGSPQGMLDNLAKMLTPTGRIVLTTPNPYMIHRTWKQLRGFFPDSVDHVTLLGPSNIAELATRSGLDLVSWRGIRLRDLAGWKNKVTSGGRKALIKGGCAPEIACDSLIYELALAPARD